MENTIFEMRQQAISHQVLKVRISVYHDPEGQGGG